MKTIHQRLWVFALGSALTLALAACGPASAPRGGAGGDAGVSEAQKSQEQSFARAIVKYEDEMADLSNYPEPPPNKAGGIPPEDLTATPKMGGTLNIDASGPADPRWGCCSTGWQYRVIGMGLLRWDLRCNCAQPDLAESWTVGKDGLSYDFKLRKGVKWQNLPPVNGRDVTAEDIKWSLDTVSGILPVKGKAAVFSQRFVNVKGWEVVDGGSTLRMVMKQPDVQIMSDIMYDQIMVLPQEAAIEGGFEKPTSMIGSGPFQREYGESGGNWKLVRNPTYWEKDKAGRQLPYLDVLNIVAFGDNAGRIAAFKSRQVDMVPLQYSSGRAILGMPDVRYSYQRGLVNGGIGVYLNTKIPPFNDVKMRHAINLALDREEWIEVVQGGHDAGFVVGSLGAWEPWSWSEAKMWSMPGYAKGDAKQKEIEEAKRIIKEAGYGGGLNVIYNGQSVLENEVIRAQLKNVGITTKEIPYGAGKYTSTTIETGRQIAYSYQGGGHVPDAAIVASFLCDSTQNVALYCNPELDKLFFQWRKTRESDKRMELLNKLQQILWDDMPMAPGVRHNTIHAGYKYVRGYRNSWYDLRWSQGYQMAYVWLDK